MGVLERHALGATTVALVWCLCGPVFGVETADIYRTAAPSVCLVTSMDAYGQPLSLGSGFVVDDAGSVLTNFHVIEGAAAVRIRFPSGSVHQITHVAAYDTAQDMALLESDASSILPLPLGASAVDVGEAILAIGNPRGLEGTLSAGIISGVRTFGDGTRFYQITAPISPGSSGGPVLNERGQVVGIATATLDSGQNLNFAVPITTTGLSGLRKRAAPPIPLSALVAGEKPDRGNTREGGLVGLAAEGAREAGLYNGREGVSFSLSSSLPYPVTDVRLLIVCYGRSSRDTQPLHHLPVKVSRTIPPGLGIRVWAADATMYDKLRLRDWRVEFRILDWKVLPASGGALEFREAK